MFPEAIKPGTYGTELFENSHTIWRRIQEMILHLPLLFFPNEIPISTCFIVGGLHVCMLSSVWLFATLWTVARQAPLSMGFSRQEYWSELPCPTSGDLLDPGIEHVSYCIGRWVLYHCYHLGSPTVGGVRVKQCCF